MVQLVGSSSLGLGKLVDGKNQFVHIMYSANADGSNMTAEIQANTKYIGIMTSSSETPPSDPSRYSWGRFVGTSGSSSYTWIRYSPNEDGSSMTTTANEETKYIGVAITSENSAPTDYTRYSWALFKGNDGRGVEETEVSYQKSTSGTVIPTGSWETTIPSLDDGEYLWTRTLFTYTDGTTTSTFSVSRNGMAGLGISGTDVHYQKSTSGTTAPTGTWTATIPDVGPNEYLWTRTTMTYTDASTRVSYSVGKMGADGRDAQLLYLTASSQIQAFDKDNRPKTTQPITVSAKLQNASGTATFTAIPYIGNTAQTPITLGGTGNDRTLLPSQWTNTQWTIIAITATLGSLTDIISINRVKDGDTGPRGSDGIAGKDGVGIANTSITYAQSTSGTTAPETGWAAQVPTLIKGQYLWTKTTWTYTDNSTETGYTVSYNAKDGNNGADGIAGKDGVGIASTSIQYAGSTSGTTQPTSGWSNQVPSVPGGQYLWTKIVWTYTDGTSETGYSVARMGERGPQGLQGIQGPKGDQGIAGTNGTDGRTSYTHIAYADSADGTTNFSVSDSNRSYIGMYVDFNPTDSTNPSSYQWSLIKGADGQDGADGLPGPKGADGRTPYFHTAYANSADGSSGFSTTDSNGKLYLGTCTDYNQADPTDYHAYTWVKIKGDKGDQGIQGPSGANGQSLYTWLKYADDASGNGMSETPDGKKYIGLAYNKTTATESTNPSDYTWSLIQGANGVKGADGITHYTWVKYADNASGGGLSDSPTGKSYIGLAYNKTTPTESTNPGDYTWSLIQGPQGPAGQNGKGVASYSITYQAGTSGTTAPTGTWTASIPSVPQGQYLWTKMVITYTDNTSSTSYSVSYIPNNGATGATGNGVSSIIAEFYLSTSKTTQTGSSWGTTQPTWSPGKYVWTRNKITYTNGSTAYTSPQCSSEWEAVNELQVGGRNLLRDTINFDNSGRPSGSKNGWLDSYASSIETEKYNGLTVRSLKNVTTVKEMCNYYFTGFNLSDTYTLSFWAKGTINRFNCFFYGDSGYVYATAIAASSGANPASVVDGRVEFLASSISSTEWRRLFVTWKLADTGNINVAKKVLIRTDGATGGDLYVCGVKLEKGNIATDHSPAPEDTQHQIDQANENISNKVDQGAYETDQATIWGSINDKMDDAEFRAYKAVMDNLKSSYEAFVGEGGRFEQELQNATAREQAIVQELGAKVNQLNFINTYIRESEEGIVIGAKNNPMQMLLTKDSLAFMDGGQVVAYFSNQSFYINRGAVVESLQVGVHKLTKIDNYHTVIQYIPN